MLTSPDFLVTHSQSLMMSRLWAGQECSQCSPVQSSAVQCSQLDLQRSCHPTPAQPTPTSTLWDVLMRVLIMGFVTTRSSFCSDKKSVDKPSRVSHPVGDWDHWVGRVGADSKIMSFFVIEKERLFVFGLIYVATVSIIVYVMMGLSIVCCLLLFVCLVKI